MLTKEEIKNGNWLIAEFLGGKIEYIYKTKDYTEYAWKGEVAHEWRKKKMKINIGESILMGALDFHSSWDWLMPVVEKLDKILKDTKKTGNFSIMSHMTYSQVLPLFSIDIDMEMCDSKIECVYCAVVQTIEALKRNKLI